MDDQVVGRAFHNEGREVEGERQHSERAGGDDARQRVREHVARHERPGDQHGPDGVRFFTRLKTVTARWPKGVRENPDFTIPTMN